MRINLRYNDKSVELLSGQHSSFEEFYVDFVVQDLDPPNNNKLAKRINFTIHPKRDLLLQEIKLILPSPDLASGQHIFSNGYPPGLGNRLYSLHEPPPKHPASPIALDRDKESFFSLSYSYISLNDKINFIGSANDMTGFSWIQYRPGIGQWTVHKELPTTILKHSFPVFDLLWTQGNLSQVSRMYASSLGEEIRPEPLKLCWAPKNLDHFVADFPKQLEALSNQDLQLDAVLIGQQYCRHTGDWHLPKYDMRSLVELIHQHGCRAILEFSPFLCEKQSELYKSQKSWVLKSKRLRKNNCYPLDFTKKEFQTHLTGILFRMVQKWGVDQLKLDQFHSSLVQLGGNQGRLCYEAMNFFQQIVGKEKIIGQDLPLSPFCSLVSEISLSYDANEKWRPGFLGKILGTSRPGLAACLQTLIQSWPIPYNLNRVIGPSIHLKNNSKALSYHQSFTLLLVNSLLSNRLIVKDNFSDYSSEEWTELGAALFWKDAQVKKLHKIDPFQYIINFQHQGQNYKGCINLYNKARSFSIGKESLELEAFESLVLKD